ncbi:MAG: hypothetical protein K0R05_3915, partial [Anaerocolumna sp.]|nr:hypothetical protein [Anaerocolumna sp.]
GKGLVSVDEGGIIGYYRIDEKGTVIDILDKTGNEEASFRYDEFGVLGNTEGLNNYGNIFAYTGHVYDGSTGLYYAKARNYEAGNGRFISQDSYEGEINNVLTLNRYIYTLNNPTIYTDPSGNIAIVDGAVVLLVLAAGAIVLVTYAYLFTPAGKDTINNGAVAIHEGRVIAGQLITKAAKATFSAIQAGTIKIGEKISDGLVWVGNKIVDVWGGLTSKISGKKASDKGEGKSVKPEAKVKGSGKHGVKWKEGAAREKDTGKPQGQWAEEDLDIATEAANTLKPGESGVFKLPKGSKSIIHNPNGTTQPATKFWVRNNGTGTWHGYPMP